MVGQIEILTRGGVYLGKLNPAKHAEIGKVRPVIILNLPLMQISEPTRPFSISNALFPLKNKTGAVLIQREQALMSMS